MKKIIIFGATGTVGSHLVSQALEAGYAVTAFTRNQANLKLSHPRLSAFEGDVLDQEVVNRAVQGQEIVLCALGAGRKGEVRSKGTENIIHAMKKAGIDRLICQSTLGAGDSKGNLNFFWKRIMFGWFLKKAYLDHELQEQFILNSDLDWTVVRPAAFTNGEKTGSFKHGFSSNDKSTKLKISRADVALFMLQQINNLTYLRKTPALSY